MRSGLLDGIRWSVCMLKSHRSLCESFSRTDAGLCIYHLFVWSNWNFLHISQWITLPTQSYLALYSFCANLLHSLIMWLIVSSLSPHSLHLLFCCVLSILALIWLVLMALSCAAIRRDSVSLLRFPFLSQVQVFWCEMLFIRRLKQPESCFPPHFCYLVVVILSFIVLSVSTLMVVISPRSCFSMLPSSRCMDASTVSSMLACPLPPSFLDTYSLSTSSIIIIIYYILLTYLYDYLFGDDYCKTVEAINLYYWLIIIIIIDLYIYLFGDDYYKTVEAINFPIREINRAVFKLCLKGNVTPIFYLV